MGVHATLFASAARPMLARNFAEPVTRWRFGDEGQASEVDAIFEISQPEREYNEHGLRMVERPRLYVDAALAVDLADQWIVRGKRYAVTSVGREVGGLVTVELVAFERVTTRSVTGR